jgi:hypothetical protein
MRINTSCLIACLGFLFLFDFKDEKAKHQQKVQNGTELETTL